jgi:hypothetical protein
MSITKNGPEPALALCAIAAAVTLGDVQNYNLTWAAALSIVTYLAGYVGRFSIMSRHAKTGTPGTAGTSSRST